MASVINCGYARVGILEAGRLVTVNGGDMYNIDERRFEEYNSLVGEDSLMMDMREFNICRKKVVEKFRCWNKKSPARRKEREEYVAYFSSTRWKELPSSKRSNHTLRDCKACRNDNTQVLFTRNCETKRFKNAMNDITKHSNIVMSTPGNKGDIAKQAYDNLR